MTVNQTSAKRRKGARAIGRIAAEVTGGAFQRHGLGHGEIAHAWPHLVGPALAKVSRPERIAPPRKGDRAGGTLHVSAAGALAIDLTYAERDIVSGVNAIYGQAVISRIKVTQSGAAAGRARAATHAIPPAADTKQYMDFHSASLRDALARLEGGIASDEAARNRTAKPARG